MREPDVVEASVVAVASGDDGDGVGVEGELAVARASCEPRLSHVEVSFCGGRSCPSRSTLALGATLAVDSCNKADGASQPLLHCLVHGERDGCRGRVEHAASGRAPEQTTHSFSLGDISKPVSNTPISQLRGIDRTTGRRADRVSPLDLHAQLHEIEWVRGDGRERAGSRAAVINKTRDGDNETQRERSTGMRAHHNMFATKLWPGSSAALSWP